MRKNNLRHRNSRGIGVLRGKIILAVIELFGSCHSACRGGELRHVVVHVISVLGGIDSLIFSTVASFTVRVTDGGRENPLNLFSHLKAKCESRFESSENIHKYKMEPVMYQPHKGFRSYS